MISMIAAVGKNFELGKGNDLIWHLPSDMKFFRGTTSGHTIIMGRKTFDSLGGVLPKRHHVVLTSNADWSYEGVEVLHTVDDVLEKYENTDEECFVIGGGEIYKLFLPYARKMYLTYVDDECIDAEVYFPSFDETAYAVTDLQSFTEDGISATVKEFVRL